MVFGSWYEHVKGWWEKKQTSSDILYLFYEDLIKVSIKMKAYLCSIYVDFETYYVAFICTQIETFPCIIFALKLLQSVYVCVHEHVFVVGVGGIDGALLNVF